MEQNESQPPAPVYLTANIRGIVIPVWLGLLLGIAAFMGTLILAIVLLLGGKILEIQRQELRILQLHAQDVENVLIRANLATRSDFAPWQGSEESKPKKGEEDVNRK